MNLRRIGLVIIILAAAAFVGFGIYRIVVSRSTTTPSTDTAGNLPNAGTQTIPQQSLGNTPVGTVAPAQTSKRAESVLAYWASNDNVVVAVQLDGKIIKTAGTSSVPISLSNASIGNIISASFSSDGTKILVLFGNANALKASIFDIPTLSWTAVSGSFADAAWAPQGYVIATLSVNAKTGGTDISTITLGTKVQTQAIASMTARALRVVWQQAGILIVYDRPSAFAEGTAWTINTKTKTVVPLVRETLGMDLTWTPRQNIGLLFQSSVASQGGSLALIDPTGGQIAGINFLTLPSKCAFASPLLLNATTTSAATGATGTVGVGTTGTIGSYLVCGVPSDADYFASLPLPDAYYQKALFTVDRLVVVDLRTQAIVFVGSTPNAADATSLQLVGSNIYFVNRYDNALYEVPFQ